jgi:hypothetical protein
MKYLLLSLLTLSTLAYGNEIKLGVITSDIDQNVTDFSVDLKEDGSVDSLHVVTTEPNGQISVDAFHPLERVVSSGAVLYERDGREVIRLKVENFSATEGGVVKISYLYNGLNNSWGSMKLQMKKINDVFGLATLTDERVNKLFVRANRSLFGVIGIKEIRASWGK